MISKQLIGNFFVNLLIRLCFFYVKKNYVLNCVHENTLENIYKYLTYTKEEGDLSTPKSNQPHKISSNQTSMIKSKLKNHKID